MTEAVRPRIELTKDAVELGFRGCRQKVRKYIGDYTWIGGNLPNPNKRAIDTILWHSIQCMDLLDLESPNHLPLDVWSDVRADVSDAFLDQCTSEEVAALVHSIRKFNVPKQFLFDMLDGCDAWIRNRKFDTFENLSVFAYRLGGAPLAASIPILGYTKPGYEVSAIRCGQAIFLTQIVANCVNNMKRNRNFIAEEDIHDCEIIPHRLKMREGGKPWSNLVRLYCSRIEKMYYESAELLDYLDYDGVRCIKSLLATHWKMLIKMKLDPECALSEDGVLTKKDFFLLKSRHIMGLEGNVPFLSQNKGHHH